MLTSIPLDDLKAALYFYMSAPDGQYDQIAVKAIQAYIETHYSAFWRGEAEDANT